MKNDHKKLTAEIDELKTKVVEPLTNKCTKMLLEMAKKEDLKSLKKEVSSLKDKSKHKDPESQIEDYMRGMDKRIDDFESRVNKSINSFRNRSNFTCFFTHTFFGQEVVD